MPINLPTPPGSTPGYFVRSTFGLETNTQVFESPLSRATQRGELVGSARWVATYTIRRLKKAEAGPWMGFFLSLRGMVDTFNAYDPDRKTAQGVATGTPLVKGASQTGISLDTDGWTTSQTGILKAGDYFSVNGELKMVTADCNSDGSGNATISFQPPLRSSPADNAPLTVSSPTCTMILADDRQAIWEADANGVYEEKTFSAYEVFS